MRRDGTKRLTAWALALALFALGVAAGVASDRALLGRRHEARRGPPTPEVVLERMKHELRLNDAQSIQVGGVLDARWRALSTLFARVDPEAERIRADANQRIRALLDEEQRARFDAQVAESERRRSELRARLERPTPAR